MGNESYVHTRGASGALVVRVVGAHAPVASGDTVWLGVDAERLHVFDAADQRRR
jgi:ABC-type sugar transport system ATPase subunit